MADLLAHRERLTLNHEPLARRRVPMPPADVAERASYGRAFAGTSVQWPYSQRAL